MFQQLLPNGKTGASGPNVQPLVARGSNSGLVPAVNQTLEATTSVLEMRQRSRAVAQLNAQVNIFNGCMIYVGNYLLNLF